MNNFGYHPPIQPRDPFRNRRERYPVEPIQPEIQSTQPQAPSIQIQVRFDKEAPELAIIEPTKQSVKALADWYRTNGITPKHIPIS